MANLRVSNLVGRLFIFTLALSLGLSIAAPDSFADASKQECSCDLGSERSRPVGAEVLNAATCVRQQFNKWCDIYIASLEGSQRHQEIIVSLFGSVGALNPDGDGDGVSALLELFDQFAASSSASDNENPIEREMLLAHRDILEKRFDVYTKELQACIAGFAEFESINIRREGFDCKVGRSSSWLDITISVEQHTYSFLFSPVQK